MLSHSSVVDVSSANAWSGPPLPLITYRLLAASMAGDHPFESRTRLAFTPTTTILRGMGSNQAEYAFTTTRRTAPRVGFGCPGARDALAVVSVAVVAVMVATGRTSESQPQCGGHYGEDWSITFAIQGLNDGA